MQEQAHHACIAKSAYRIRPAQYITRHSPAMLVVHKAPRLEPGPPPLMSPLLPDTAALLIESYQWDRAPPSKRYIQKPPYASILAAMGAAKDGHTDLLPHVNMLPAASRSAYAQTPCV